MNGNIKPCFVCNSTKRENRKYEIDIDGRIVYFGNVCLNEILIQYVKDCEAKDATMTERMNRHEAEGNEESIKDAYDILTDLMRMHKGMNRAWRSILHARNHVAHQLKERF